MHFFETLKFFSGLSFVKLLNYKNEKTNTNIAISATLLAIICVQGGASIAKQLFRLSSIGTVTLRIVLSAIILTLVNRPKFSQFTRQMWIYCGFTERGLP